MIRIFFLWIVLSAFFLNKPVLGLNIAPVIILDPPLESSCLCGQIRVYTERKGLEGALIEEVTPDFEQVIQSTHSVKNGYFKFPEISSEEFHYICVSNGLGFRTVCYKIKISKKVKKTLIIEIHYH